MANLITANDGTSDTTAPTLVLGYQSEHESQNVVYDLIGGGIAVALIQPRPRSGTLDLFYPVEADAEECRTIHIRETTFQLITDRDSVGMVYVVAGRVRVSLDDETRDHWTVSVDYQEIVT